jgi:hypothetical protein
MMRCGLFARCVIALKLSSAVFGLPRCALLETSVGLPRFALLETCLPCRSRETSAQAPKVLAANGLHSNHPASATTLRSRRMKG